VAFDNSPLDEESEAASDTLLGGDDSIDCPVSVFVASGEATAILGREIYAVGVKILWNDS
jgi:hypothetical protein